MYVLLHHFSDYITHKIINKVLNFLAKIDRPKKQVQNLVPFLKYDIKCDI